MRMTHGSAASCWGWSLPSVPPAGTHTGDLWARRTRTPGGWERQVGPEPSARGPRPRRGPHSHHTLQPFGVFFFFPDCPLPLVLPQPREGSADGTPRVRGLADAAALTRMFTSHGAIRDAPPAAPRRYKKVSLQGMRHGTKIHLPRTKGRTETETEGGGRRSNTPRAPMECREKKNPRLPGARTGPTEARSLPGAGRVQEATHGCVSLPLPLLSPHPLSESTEKHPG